MCQEDVGGETYLSEFATNSGLSMVISVYKPLYVKNTSPRNFNTSLKE